jgi:peptide/histidine transporter 3/4
VLQIVQRWYREWALHHRRTFISESALGRTPLLEASALLKAMTRQQIASSSPLLTPSKTVTPGGLTIEGGRQVDTSHWDQRPAKYAANVITKVCIFIFIAAVCEETTHYAVVQSLKNFFVKLGWSNKGSNSMKTTFDSICQFACIFAGYFSDEKLGNFKTLLTASGVNAIGLTLVVVAAIPAVLANAAASKALFNVGLFLGVGLTQISIYSLTVSFGGDQFSPNAPPEQKATFFTIHYWAAKFGTAIAYGIFPTISSHGISGFVPAEYGYFFVYLVACALTLVIVTILTITRKRYVKLPPKSDSIGVVIQIVLHRARTNVRAQMLVLGAICYIAAMVLNIPAAFLSDHGSVGNNLSYVSGLLCLLGTVLWVYFGRTSEFMDGSKEHFDSELVDGVKKVVRVLPFNAFNAFWWMCQNQRANNQTTTQQTDVRLGSGIDATQLPAATIQMTNPFSAIFWVPLLYKVVFPLYERVTGRPATHFGKIITGYLVATFAMFWSGFYELIRRNAGPLTYVDTSGETQYILNTESGKIMNDIGWYTALPQYFLVSLAGAFIVIPSYDICYSEVPQRMRSTSIALSFFVMSIGSTMLSSLVLLFGNYIPSNLNNGHMEYMYYATGGIMLVATVFFWLVMNQMHLGTGQSASKLDEVARASEVAGQLQSQDSVNTKSGTQGSDTKA